MIDNLPDLPGQQSLFPVAAVFQWLRIDLSPQQRRGL
jgi:hypothetical protein